jgi:uncharacterized membrane protein YkvA (DUF1232 family)
MSLSNLKKILEHRLQNLKAEVGALYFAYKANNTPFVAKFIAMIVVAYALSPIDLIPDFIPILGYLDDVILLPLGIALAIRLIPDNIMEESRRKADKYFAGVKKNNWVAAAIIMAIWSAVIIYAVYKTQNVIVNTAPKR